MLQELLSDAQFSNMMRSHVKEVIGTLLKRGINFSILTNVSEIEFEPPLPTEISSNFKPITMFVLAGYTFESCSIDDDELSFEAGFGPANFASLVTIPVLSVLQVIVEETPIFINLSIDLHKKEKKKAGGVKRSMEALLANPENEKLLKR